MYEQQINEIKNAIREMIQLITQREEPLSNELKLQIVQVMEHAANRINQLRQEQAQNAPTEQLTPTPQPLPQLEPGPFPSSNINAFRYDPNTQRLLVKFHGKDSADSGPIYGYEGVPGFIYDVFRRGAVGPKTSGRNRYHTWVKGVTPSLGASLYALVKNGGYPYQRLQ